MFVPMLPLPWPRIHSVSSWFWPLPTCPPGPLSTSRTRTLNFEPGLSLWYRRVHSVDCQVRMPMLTYNSSLKCATTSSSRTSHPRQSSSIYFPFPLWER
jgi:hypothetical protein